MKHTDFLVIGSGVAGLTFALKTALRFPDRRITIVTKTMAIESNTRYAQGGIAVVSNDSHDSFEEHIADTIKAGDGLCNEQVVEMVIRQGPERLAELISWGTKFDRESAQSWHLGKEGGHSANRILHRGDATGLEIEQSLLRRVKAQPNIQIRQHHLVVDLLVRDNLCHGAILLHTKNAKRFLLRAKFTLLAAGGAGQVYLTTTNPLVATGDGIAMAARAGAQIADMEFVQFHPTALYESGKSPAFLISEAVRGAGAILRNSAGVAFMHHYDPHADLAFRDIVARAIFNEMRSTGAQHVMLDCRHIDRHIFKLQFPNIHQKCAKLGIDLSVDMIPVIPAAHYICGGVVVDHHGRTSINRLYACGECSRTGLHGANRLASNSLLEAIVYAHRSFKEVSRWVEQYQEQYQEQSNPTFETPTTCASWNNSTDTSELKLRINETMERYAGIERKTDDLHVAAKTIAQILDELQQPKYFNPDSPQWNQTRNLAETARLIIEQSIARKENRGTFFNTDLKPSAPNLPLPSLVR